VGARRLSQLLCLTRLQQAQANVHLDLRFVEGGWAGQLRTAQGLRCCPGLLQETNTGTGMGLASQLPPGQLPSTMHTLHMLVSAHLQQRQVAHDRQVLLVHAQSVLVALDGLIVLAVGAVQQAAGGSTVWYSRGGERGHSVACVLAELAMWCQRRRYKRQAARGARYG